MLWEALSATPVTPRPVVESGRRRTVNSPVVFSVMGMIVWGGSVAVGTAVTPAAADIGLASAVAVAVVVAFWQKVRSTDKYYRCPDCGMQSTLSVCEDWDRHRPWAPGVEQSSEGGAGPSA
ncbi:hypothetical protein ACIBUQ_06710 [Nonomuraea sp. NPDC049377]|uniref:hypothetical protein n=1 Tax=Nonomuraea sp. NPDC049377 TaxID=3364351 RepID=UPI0037B49BD2